MLSASETHLIVLPGGGYSEHAAHEAEPILDWLNGLGVPASVFRYPLMVRHPEPLDALRAEIRRLRDGGAERIGLIGFSAGGHLAGLAALAPGADPGEAVDFAVLGYAITSMETETYRPARLTLLGDDATPELRRATSLDALVMLQHFRGNLDNWDPTLVDALARRRRVITFDNRGVAASSGTTPNTIAQMAFDAIDFIDALGVGEVDLLGFSIGSFLAQEIALVRPSTVRKVVLASSAPQGASGMHGWGV
jgi:acetyl esterase/lipase